MMMERKHPALACSVFMSTKVLSCRMKIEQEAKVLEVELLEQATAREQELLAVISTLQNEALEWKDNMMQLLISFQPEMAVCYQ